MQIFLDEHCFVSYFENVTEGLSSLQAMIDLMEVIIDATHLELFVPENIFSFDINGVTIGELIYANYADSTVRDILRQFEYIVNAAELIPENIEHGPSAVAGLRNAKRGGVVTNWDCEAQSWWCADRMHKITNVIDLRSSIRTFFVTERLSEAEFCEYSKSMFDSLYFHCPADNIKNLGLKFVNFVSEIVKHLAYLNDRALIDFEECANDREVSTRAGSHGVNMSPESHATRNDRKAMQQREVTVLKVPIVCEWHTKLTRTQGRIHFYPWTGKHDKLAKLIGKKVIIGIICEHLD